MSNIQSCLSSRPPPISPLFPYTTLFRSYAGTAARMNAARSSFMRASDGRWMYIMWPAAYSCTVMFARSDSSSPRRSEEHTSELQSHHDLVCRLLLEKKNTHLDFTAVKIV